MASVQLSRSREIKRKRYIPKGFQRIVKKKQFAVFHSTLRSCNIVYAVKATLLLVECVQYFMILCTQKKRDRDKKKKEKKKKKHHTQEPHGHPSHSLPHSHPTPPPPPPSSTSHFSHTHS